MNRRRFLINTSLAITHLVAVNSLLNNSGLLANVLSEETIQQKLKRAADLRRAATQTTSGLRSAGRFSSSGTNFNHSDLTLAKSIYDEVIAINNLEIRAYDGLRKILLQSKFQELAVLNLYFPLSETPVGNIKFTERVAKEYMRLALGNRKFVTQLNTTPEELLENSKLLFDSVRTALPLNKDYQIQYQKVENKISLQTAELDARDNPLLKIKKREDRQVYKHRYDGFTAAMVGLRVDKMRTRANPHQFRDASKIMIGKLIEEGDVQLALAELQSLYYYDYNDTNTLWLLRKTCTKNNAYDILEEVDRFNNSVKDSLWSNIALFDTLLLRHKKEGVGDFSEMEIFLDNAWPQANSFTKKFEVKSRRIKFTMAQNNTVAAYNLLIDCADFITGITSSHWIDRFNFLCADYYKRNNEIQKGILVYNIALQENDMPLDDTLLKKVHIVNKQRDKDVTGHNDTLRYFRDLLAN